MYDASLSNDKYYSGRDSSVPQPKKKGVCNSVSTFFRKRNRLRQDDPRTIVGPTETANTIIRF
jgi:hypothetical protein